MSRPRARRAVLSQPATYAKAITGTTLAFLGALGVAMTDGQITGLEWIGIASTTIIAAGSIFGVGNADAEPEQSEQEGRHN